MATELMQGGVRRYTCLTPIVLVVDGEQREWRAIHLLPVTRKTIREWHDGLIDGPNGMLEALIDRLTYEPYYVIEEMQHPDVGLFDQEFMCHLPPSIRDGLARGEFPASAVPPYIPQDGQGEPYEPEWSDPEPPPPPPPRRPPPPIPRDRTPVAPAAAAPAPEPSPHAHMEGANFELAEMGPDPSLGTPEQQARAEEARRQAQGDGKDLARDLTDEPADPQKSPLAAAVERAQAPPPEPAGWQPTARDPFNPAPLPPKRPTIRPPTRVSAESMPLEQALPGTPQQIAPVVDPNTGREAVFAPKGDYVPDMSAAGYEPSPNRAASAFGIGDLEP